MIHKIKILEELARSGDEDEVLLQAIDKLTKYKINGLERDLKEIKSQLSLFEDKYHMGNDEFSEKFDSGEMGDDVDHMEWSSLLDMRNRLKMRYNILKGV